MISSAGPHRLSLINLAAAAAVQSVTSQAASWPATNALAPERPFVPWRTTATTQQDLVLDVGTSASYQLLLLIHVNVASVEIETDTATDFSPSAFGPVALAPAVNDYNDRRAVAYVFPAARTDRYVRLRVPAQTPTDGASYFSVGGIYLGALVDVPPIRLGEEIEVIEPREVLRTPSGAEQELLLGEPYTEIRYTRMSLTKHQTIGNEGDDLAAWKALDRQMRSVRHFAWWLNYGSAAECWIMRAVNDRRYTIDPVVAEDELHLREVIGP